MKTLIALAAMAALIAPAVAGVLPFEGAYCLDDRVLSADGVWGDSGEGCAFTKILSSGDNWWVVAQECDAHDWPTSRIELTGLFAEVTNAGDGTSGTALMRRCDI